MSIAVHDEGFSPFLSQLLEQPKQLRLLLLSIDFRCKLFLKPTHLRVLLLLEFCLTLHRLLALVVGPLEDKRDRHPVMRVRPLRRKNACRAEFDGRLYASPLPNCNRFLEAVLADSTSGPQFVTKGGANHRDLIPFLYLTLTLQPSCLSSWEDIIHVHRLPEALFEFEPQLQTLRCLVGLTECNLAVARARIPKAQGLTTCLAFLTVAKQIDHLRSICTDAQALTRRSWRQVESSRWGDEEEGERCGDHDALVPSLK
mmetsp:Transcript_2997/g.6328  ORF Transcript_2997/g.6328 Transcript_2997/m.6328 type:complete len:257 (-) Transcript_2997:2-772(-)